MNAPTPFLTATHRQLLEQTQALAGAGRPGHAALRRPEPARRGAGDGGDAALAALGGIDLLVNIADPAVHLASAESDGLTGQSPLIDGGMLMV